MCGIAEWQVTIRQYGKFIIFVPRGRHHLLAQGYRGQSVNDIRRQHARVRVGLRPGSVGDGLGGLPRRGVRGRGVHLRQERQHDVRPEQEDLQRLLQQAEPAREDQALRRD